MTLSAITGGRAQVFWGLSVSFPGSTMRLSSAPFVSLTGGQYVPKVLNWGRISYSLSDRGGRLNAVETRVTVADTDRSIARIVSGASADSVRGSVAVIYLATPTVASSSWLTVFSGVVAKVSFPKPFVAEITIRTADDQLLRVSPRGGWALTRVQWPNAKPEVFDTFAPIIYGYHDSANLAESGPGMVGVLKVDTAAFRYLVSAGKMKAITRLFVDGALTTTGWSVEYVTRAGRIYTTILFTTDQADAVITVDLEGLESVGDGSGSVITNAATIWAHRLSNFVLDDWMTGAWLSTSSLIDATALSAAETYFTNLTDKCSVHAQDKQTGLDITGKVCTSKRMRSYWTLGGKLAMSYENIFAAPYSGTRWRWYRDEVGEFSLSDDDHRVTSRILAKSALSQASGTYMQTLEMVDASVTNHTQEVLELELSEAK